MPEPTQLTDSQVAAIAARDALNDRRYALAEAFARVARIAAQHEAAQAKYDAHTAAMKQESDALLDQWAQIQAGEAEAVAAAGATPIGNSFAAQLDADATAIGVIPQQRWDEAAAAPAEAAAVVIPEPAKLTDEQAWQQSQNQPATTSRCRQEKTYSGPDGSISREYCDLAIYLGPDRVWRHVHLSLDHPAVPPHTFGAIPKPAYLNPAADMSRDAR